MFCSASFSPFYAVWDPSSGNGAVHSGWVFPSQSNQERSAIGMPKGQPDLDKPYTCVQRPTS